MPLDSQSHITVPLFRRLWVVVSLTCLLVTFPVAMVLLLTGDVYRKSGGSYRPIKASGRYVYGGLLVLWLIAIVGREIAISDHQDNKGGTDKTAAATTDNTSSSAAANASLGGTQEDWQLKTVTSAIDGDSYTAAKSFLFPEQKSQINLSLTCTPRTKNVRITLESYNDTEENGRLQGNPLVTHTWNVGERPAGRIKIGQAEPITLGALFLLDDYSNVASWSVLERAQESYVEEYPSHISQPNELTDDELRARNEGESKVGAGNYLAAHLPIIIEIENGGGTEQVTIPTGDPAVDKLIAQCTATDLPPVSSATEPPSAPPNDTRSASTDVQSETAAPGH